VSGRDLQGEAAGGDARGFWESTRYWPPSGKGDSQGSSGRSERSGPGKTEVKSVLSTEKPASRISDLAWAGQRRMASRSKGTRDMTKRVAGFHGLFSQKAKTPPGLR